MTATPRRARRATKHQGSAPPFVRIPAAVALVVLAAMQACYQGGAGSPLSTQEPTERPNVLIVVTDDQRVDTLSVMPATRRWFGRGGRLFRQAFATTPLCCPSRASIFTGRYAHNHAVRTNDDAAKLDPGTTIQRRLQDAGYTTAIAGKYLNDWDVMTPPPHFDEWALARGMRYYDTFNVNGSLRKIRRYSTDFINQWSAAFLRRSEGNDSHPWFLYVAPIAAHATYRAEPDYATAPVPSWRADRAIRERDVSDKPPYVQRSTATLQRAREVRRDQLRTLMSVDDLVADLSTILRRLGEERRTLAFFLSDNGLMWHEHGLKDKKRPYTQSVRIPMFMRWPGHVGAGSVDRRLVANIDVAPTVLDAAGVGPSDAAVDGRSLLEPQWTRDRLLLEYFGAHHDRLDLPLWASLRTRASQYIEYFRKDDGSTFFREYYDLRDDPSQLNNLLADPRRSKDVADVVSSLRDQLRADRTCAGASCP